MNIISKVLGKLLSIVIIGYLLIASVIFIPYYNWEYAKNNGFVKWLLLGEIVPTAKAFAWPYFAFFNSSSLSNHLINSFNYANEANKIINKGEAFTTVEPEEMDQIIDLHKKAIEEAKLVDINELNDRLNNFGNHYRDKFIKGLELIVEGYEKHDNRKYTDGSLLLYKWGEWYTANLDNIKNNRKVETIPESLKSSPSTRPPDFTASELGRYSKVLSKAMSIELNEEDLEILRSVISDYTSRTGRMLTKDEHELFIGVMKLTSDYQYELGQSMLFSWDGKKYFTTNKFDELYKVMETIRLRKAGLLENDINKIRAASQNQNYITDKSGAKYEFSREIILKGIEENNLFRNNYEKISIVMKDFVQ